MNVLLPRREGQAVQMTLCELGPSGGHWYSPAAVERLIEDARKEEREACANICEIKASVDVERMAEKVGIDTVCSDGWPDERLIKKIKRFSALERRECAKLIRKRGEK